MRYKVTFMIIFFALNCTTALASTESFEDLIQIVKNKKITYEQARHKMVKFFDKLADPRIIKHIILQSAEKSTSTYSSQIKEEFERYDEAIFIGLCKLVHTGTNESIYQIVDLIQYDLGVSNNAVLRQRITEIGRPALKQLKAKLNSLKKQKLSGAKKNQKDIGFYIQVVEECISHIEKSKTIDAGVTPCP